MPLDQFKTQVLLLHSEQSTLDLLSSGFSDRYTVHCATTGSEALNTLVATPINVMISAQKLPGMSGLEALREAKKRSPDTIGILLAGNNDQGVEALVGDEEVFQVVRGNVTGDALQKLVDNATRQMRLMALAESANDTAANLDISTGEHIIMETSENGSAIISDGTGRMPALDPKKVGTASAIGAQSVNVLVLTKDQEFLATIKESTRGTHAVHYANTLAQAEEIIRKQKTGVAVVDAAMVGEKVEQLTLHLRKGSPRLVSIVAGRRDDGEMLMDLINRGKVYRFLLKPVSPGRARLAVEASVKHHLEAPDSAFKISGASAPARPQPTPAPKPAAKPTPAPTAAKPAAPAKPTPKPAPPPKGQVTDRSKPPAPAKPVATPKQPAPAPAKKDPPLGSPVQDGLSSAFEDDGGFTETVTGLIDSVGRKLSARKESAAQGAAETTVSAPASGGGSILRNTRVIGIGAVAIIAAIAGVFWFTGGSEEATPPADDMDSRVSITETSLDFGAPAKAPASPDVASMLEEARLARDAGQIFNPLGSNAIELYIEALEADPNNAITAAELDAVLLQALSLAETALLESRIDDADAALRRVALADPDNARLPFLKAQLSQMQLRGFLTDARAAIRETRFEDAASLLAAAAALGLNDDTEIVAVREELSTARSEQRADEVLALANARLEEGDLLRPANDNARYYFELVLSNDPGNVAARQGLSVVANKLVLQARAEIDTGNFDQAGALLKDVRAIDPANAELVATAAALQSARDAVAAEQRAAAERRRLAEEQRAAEAQAEAERIAAEQRRAKEAAEAKVAAEEKARAAEVQAASQNAQAGSQSGQAEPQSGQDEPQTGQPLAAAAAAVAVPGADSAMVSPAPAPQQAQTRDAATVAAPPQTAVSADPLPVSIAALNRTRYVAPKFPRSAQRRNQSGWVDVLFTVATDGTVKDIEIRESEPGEVFVDAALRAVEKWEFEPIVENGRVVEKRAGVRMMFALE